MSNKLDVVADHLSPKSSELISLPDLIVRPAMPEDIVNINQLAEQQYFDLGLHNMQLYYETSPQTWFVATNKEGKLIGYDCYNDLGEGIHWGFQILVDSDYRGKGVTTAIFNYIGGFLKQGSNSTQLSLIRYPFRFYEFPIHGYWGVMPTEIPACETPDGYRIVPIDESNLSGVINYDKKILRHFNRAEFLQKWLCPADASLVKSLAIVDQNRNVCGFGALRLCSDFYQVNPCYTDSPALGISLLTSLVTGMKPYEIVFIEIIGTNSTSERFVHSLGLLKTSSEVRVYKMSSNEYDRRFKGEIAEEKVFALQDYWPV